MAAEPVRVMTKSYATVRTRYLHFSHTVKNSLRLLTFVNSHWTYSNASHFRERNSLLEIQHTETSNHCSSVTVLISETCGDLQCQRKYQRKLKFPALEQTLKSRYGVYLVSALWKSPGRQTQNWAWVCQLVWRETCKCYAEVSTSGYKTWECLCLCSSFLWQYSILFPFSS